MTRLLMFLAFWPATYIIIQNVDNDSIGELTAYYLGAFVVGYVGGKATEMRRRRPKEEADYDFYNN